MGMICFDLDNTLVDSDKLHVLAFQKAFKNYKLPKVKDNVIIELLGLTGNVLVKTIFPHLSDEKARGVVEEHNKYSVKYAKKFIRAFPWVKQVLKELKKDHQLGVVSNCVHKEILSILKAAGIDVKLFDIIVGDDEVRHGKPWPDEILKAEKLAHHNADYMVGDSPYDIMAGKKAKCKTIAVLTGDYSRKRLKEEKPDYIIKNLKKLPEVLKNG
ncbi:MAG: HAD family hydrolase [Nanoarchaeota archaeon]|nr:HAD family hydrolase [Nanoarchaeota archaeon]